jgi:hypothetical protein
MKISDIAVNQAFSTREPVAGDVDPVYRQLKGNRKVNTAKTSTDVSIDAVGKEASLNEQQSVNADIQQIARNIRVADQSMVQIRDVIQKMKDNLKGIVKQFPPFPPGSEERVRLLKNYNSFRKQIDQLTFPADDTGAMKIMADPEVNPEAGGWEVPVGPEGSRITIGPKQVHTGPEGLDVGALSDNATDEDVRTFLGKLDTAAEKLEQRREALAEDIKQVERMGIKPDGFEYEDMPPSVAEDKSEQVKMQLMETPGRGMTGGKAKFIAMLR